MTHSGELTMSLHIILPPIVFERVRDTGFHVSLSCFCFLSLVSVLSDSEAAELEVRAKIMVESLHLLNRIRISHLWELCPAG